MEMECHHQQSPLFTASLPELTVGREDEQNYTHQSIPANNNIFDEHCRVNESEMECSLETALVRLDATDLLPGFSMEVSEKVVNEVGTKQEEKIEKAAAILYEIFVENCSRLYSDIIYAVDSYQSQSNGTVPASDAEDLSFSNAFDSNDRSGESLLGQLSRRQGVLLRQAEQLAAELPRLSSTFQLRMMAIWRAMEQLGIKQGSAMESAGANLATPQLPHLPFANQFRKWLQSIETELDAVRGKIHGARYLHSALAQLRASQQVLQLQIETEGKRLHSVAQQQLRSANSRHRQSKSAGGDQRQLQRWHCNLEALEHRWRSSWLSSLEILELISFHIERLEHCSIPSLEGDGSELEDGEPLIKRRRMTSTPTTTLNVHPLPTATSTHMLATKGQEQGEVGVCEAPMSPPPADPAHHRPTAIPAQQLAGADGAALNEKEPRGRLYDVGYSSGENSVHEALNSLAVGGEGGPSPNGPEAKHGSDTITERIENDATTANYYKTVLLDSENNGMAEGENGALPMPRKSPLLSDSLIVQVNDESLVLENAGGNEQEPKFTDDLEELMGLMDSDQQFLQQLKLLRQGTRWREWLEPSHGERGRTPRMVVGSGGRAMREGKAEPSRVGEGFSCDASSEESDPPAPSQLLPSAIIAAENEPRSMNSSVYTANGSLPDSAWWSRKRKHQRNLKISLQAAYLNARQLPETFDYLPNTTITSGEEKDVSAVMSRSLNLPSTATSPSCLLDFITARGYPASSNSAMSSRKKLYRRRMHRSASDNQSSFHACEVNSFQLDPNFLPTLKVISTALQSSSTHVAGGRRLSMESNESNVEEAENDEAMGANYEWDEYKDPSSTIEPSLALLESTHSTLSGSNSTRVCCWKEPLLNSTLIDEDFARQLEPNRPILRLLSVDSLLALMLADSRRRLTTMEGEFHQVKSRKTAKAHRRLVKMKKEAELELYKLHSIANEAAGTVPGGAEQFAESHAPALNMEQITELESLLESWTQLTAKIDMELVPEKQDLIPYSDETEVAPGQTNRAMDDGTVIVSLHSILEEMKKQLSLLKSINGQRSEWSLEEIAEVVKARKTILFSLHTYRDDLKQLTDEARNQSITPSPAGDDGGEKVRAEIRDLLALVDLVECSLKSIEGSTRSLERLHRGFEILCNTVEHLHGRIDLLGLCGSKGKEDESSHSAISIRHELELCQERMDALETMCNLLAMQLGSHLSLAVSGPSAECSGHEQQPHNLAFVNDFLKLKTEFQRLKERFDALQSKGPGGRPNAPSSMTISGVGENRREPPSPPHSSSTVSNTNTVSTQSDVTASTISAYQRRLHHSSNGATGRAGNAEFSNGPAARQTPPTRTHSAQTVDRSRRVSRLLLGSLLFLAIGGLWYCWLVLTIDDPRGMNHWRWHLGPQLDYLRGAPPH